MAGRKRASAESASDSRSALGRIFFRPSGSPRLVVIFVACALALLVAASVTWQRVSPWLLEQPDYLITPERVVLIPSPPEWIRADVRSEALISGGMGEPQSLLDPSLVSRAAQAFALHPWVARVVQVSKHHPARLEVELEYRRPVAAVKIGESLLPVDVQGVLLPPEDFSPVEVAGYPRIEGVANLPLGSAGTAWGDPRVVAAAQVAALIGEQWKPLNFESLQARETQGKLVLDVITQGGTRVIWGGPPGAAGGAEATPAEKLSRLQKYVSEHGPLDRSAPGMELDLSSAIPLSPRPRQDFTSSRPSTQR